MKSVNKVPAVLAQSRTRSEGLPGILSASITAGKNQREMMAGDGRRWVFRYSVKKRLGDVMDRENRSG